MAMAILLFREKPLVVGPPLPEGKVPPRISASGLYIVAPDGSLWAWDVGKTVALNGDRIQFLNSKLNLTEAPQRVGTNTDWRQVESGMCQNVAIKQDGSLWAWGANDRGEAGQSIKNLNIDVPTRIGTETNWAQISTGVAHSLALKQDGSLWAWGWNIVGQLGDSTTSNRFSPFQIGSDRDWKAVSAATSASFGLKQGGTLWEWGQNPEALDIDRWKKGVSEPRQIGSDTNWVSISEGTSPTLAGPASFLAALRGDGTIWIFGRDRDWCSPLITEPNKPGARLGPDSDWRAIRAGDRCLFARKRDGSWWVCGRNSSGELGIGSFAIPQTTISVEDFTPLQRFPFDFDPWAFGSGAGHTVLLTRDGALWSWGVRIGAPEKSDIEKEYISLIGAIRDLVPGRYPPSFWSSVQRDALPHRIWRLPPEVRRNLGKDHADGSAKH